MDTTFFENNTHGLGLKVKITTKRGEALAVILENGLFGEVLNILHGAVANFLYKFLTYCKSSKKQDIFIYCFYSGYLAHKRLHYIKQDFTNIVFLKKILNFLQSFYGERCLGFELRIAAKLRFFVSIIN